MYVANHIWINIISRDMLNWLIQICDKCGTSYVALQTLRLHTREKHPVYYLRKFCDLKFREKSKLQVILPLAD